MEDSLVAGGLKVAIPEYKSKLCVPDLSIVAELRALEENYKKGILPEPDSPLDMEKSPSS